MEEKCQNENLILIRKAKEFRRIVVFSVESFVFSISPIQWIRQKFVKFGRSLENLKVPNSEKVKYKVDVDVAVFW